MNILNRGVIISLYDVLNCRRYDSDITKLPDDIATTIADASSRVCVLPSPIGFSPLLSFALLVAGSRRAFCDSLVIVDT